MPPETELPAGLVEQLRAQQDQMREQQHEMAIREAELALAERRMILAWAAVFCSCHLPWSGLEAPVPCQIHSQVMFHYRTGKLVM